MARALEDLHIEGLGQQRAVPLGGDGPAAFASGALSTRYIADEFPDGFHGLPSQRLANRPVAAAAAHALRHRPEARRRDTPRSVAGAVGLGRVVRPTPRRCSLRRPANGLEMELHRGGPQLRLQPTSMASGPVTVFRGRLDGRPFTATVGRLPEGFDIRHRAAHGPRAYSHADHRPSFTSGCPSSLRPTLRGWCSRPCRAW